MDEDLKNQSVSAEPEDVSFEEVDEGGDSLSFKDKLRQLKKELADCQRAKEEYLAGWQRAKADLLNSRRDWENEKREIYRRVETKTIESFLPVLDAFDLAMGKKEVWESAPANWRVGIEYIQKEFLKILAEADILPFGEAGEIFDPNLHLAVEEVEVLEGVGGKIVNVLQRGYKQVEQVIRPAKVLVGKEK